MSKVAIVARRVKDETVMNKFFAEWNSVAEWCHMKDGYAHTETNVT